MSGPDLENHAYYGNFLTLNYTIEWDNLYYNDEMACYSAAVNEYAEQMRLFNESEERRRTASPNLDKKIERAKQRLANLEAHRDGKPLPFPDLE